MKLLKVRAPSRLSLWIKLVIISAIFWIIMFTYISFFKSNLLKDFQKEDMNIENLKSKLAELARGFKQEDGNDQLIDFPVNEREEIKAELKLDDGITEEARRYMRELGFVNPGENGDAVNLPANMSAELKELNTSEFGKTGYNSFVSSMISLNRFVPDIRSDVCKNKTYTNLPKCSIIIILHNEHWLLLMRTIHSILLRSPIDLIEEILLVDDASDQEDLQKPLDDHIKTLPKVRIIRTHRRLGIIANRNFGAVNAVGPILINVDSHIEVAPGWLEPILDRFAKDMNVLVWPRMSHIDRDTLQIFLSTGAPTHLGGFKWNMDFDWLSLKDFEGDKPTETWEPKPTPTVTGAAYAISKEFYKHLGMLDPDFDVYGGEDVELSFKSWLCGGKVEMVPCSFVAHMFKKHKYSWPKSEKGGYRWNTDRIAEVWLDEYKRYYYRMVGDTKTRNYGDITERIEIRKKIGCKPFKWFIDNVFPNMPIPENIRDPPQKIETATNKTN